jgi:curved DNA-binding protein CbpA
MLEIENCYKILQADSKCTDLELRRKFRKRALESHPDKNI